MSTYAFDGPHQAGLYYAPRGFGSLPAQDALASKACSTLAFAPDGESSWTQPAKLPASLEATDSRPGYSLWQLVMYALKLSTFGFGGPVALVGYEDAEARHGAVRRALCLVQGKPGRNPYLESGSLPLRHLPKTRKCP